MFPDVPTLIGQTKNGFKPHTQQFKTDDSLIILLVHRSRPLPKTQAVNLNTLVTDIVDEFEALAIASSLQLKTEILVDQPVIVLGDAEQLYRLISNLITNAIQYTPNGGAITIRLNTHPEQAVIQVQDTGIGIPDAEQAHIFDRFYRVNGDRSRHTGGSGLGLAIAQAIAQAHQGHLQVQAVEGQGSTFTLSL
jgi:signal transduction histidine kinase